jgi:glycoside/pentoside/hexuronide:cation symporter, GPH family
MSANPNVPLPEVTTATQGRDAPPLSPPSNWKQRLAYSAGGILDQWGLHGLKNSANPVFNIVLGINPAMVGGIMAFSRVWDACTDPIMGSITDNARTRWGRRRPFIAMGALLSAITFLPLWIIPGGLSTTAVNVWITVASLAFYTAFTIFSVPYHALAYEIAPSYHEKTKLLGVRMIFSTVSMFGVAWIFPFTQTGWFGSPENSVRALAVIVAVVLLLSGFLPALLKDSAKEIAAVNLQRKVPLREGLGIAMRSTPFVRLLFAAGLTVIGLNMINALGTYVNVYHVHGGDARAASIVGGWGGTLYGVTVLVVTPVLVWLAKRVGKRNALLICFACVLVGTISKWWLYTPTYPWLQLGVTVMLAPGMTGLWMISESMVADVSEYEQINSHVRTEGTYGAVYGWFLKSGLAFGVFISGLILVWSGFDVAKGPAQSPETVLWLRFLFAFVPAVAIITAMVVLARFPLTPEKMAEVRVELDRRAKKETAVKT